MASISLPITQPVDKPDANPRQFGSVGNTLAGLGEETEQLAAGASAVAGHLLAAQRQVKAKQAEIAFDRMKMQVYTDLNKATTPEEAQQIYEHSKGQLDSVLTPYENDRVLARSLGLYRMQQDVEIQGTVNAKKADIITKADRAANATLATKSLQDAITTTVGGGKPDAARTQFELQLESSVTHGTMLPEQAAAAMQEWDQDYEKGLIEAYTNSPDGTVRKSNIANLKAGGESYPNLDTATKNALLTKAMSRDREIGNLQESEDYNASVNKFMALTGTWDYESKVKALESGEWLQNNGFVDANGQPDRKKAEMLLEEATREDTRQHKIQTDRDNDIVSKYADDADTGKLSAPKIDQIVREAGGSPKASATLRSILRQHVREARAEAREARVESHESQREARDKGNDTSADLYRRMAKGDAIDPVTDIWDKVDSGEMTVSQAKSVNAAYKKNQHEDFRSNLNKIANSTFSKDAKGKMSEELTKAVEQQNLQGKAMSDFTDNLIKEQGKSHTKDVIMGLYNRIFGGPGFTPLGASPVPEGDTQPASSSTTPAPKQDYDVAGYESEHGKGSYAQQLGKGHFPDTYKLPSHITFSSDSKYSKPGQEGGQWREVGKHWYFTPSEFNLKQHSIQEYMDYFDSTEKGSTLRIRKNGKLYDYIGNDQWQPVR